MANGETDQERLRRRALGWGLECEPTAPGADLGRDLRLVEDGGGNVDFARVESIDNLAQSLAVGLTTLRGTDVFNVDFGFDGLNALTEGSDPLMTRERVRISIVNLLTREPRVRRIVDVKLGDERLDQPRTSGDRTLEVRVAFETVAGDQATVDLGGLPNG